MDDNVYDGENDAGINIFIFCASLFRFTQELDPWLTGLPIPSRLIDL